MTPQPPAGLSQKELPKMPTDQQLTIFLKNNDPIELNIANGLNLTNASVPLICKEPKLQVLYIRSSSIDADGFKEITRALGKQLTRFSLSHNSQLKPKDIIEIFQNCADLKLVAAQGVNTTDEVVASFARFSNLERLEISGKKTSPRALEGLGRIKSLKFLMLNHTFPDSRTIRDIAEKFPNLEDLHLIGAKLKKADLTPLHKLPLKHLWVSPRLVSKKSLDQLQKAIGPSLEIHTEGYRRKESQPS